MRAIIVGSGIGGLSAALAFRRVGVEVTVYERAPELTEVGAGISLWANALRALDYIGAGPAVRAVALPMQQAEFRVRDGYAVVASHTAAALEQRFGVAPFVAVVHRAELVAALAGCLPAGVARYGFECVGVEPGGERAVVRFKDGSADEADVVVGADGIRSAVRASLLGPEEPRYAGYTCWRGVCPRPASVAPGYVGEWWGRGRRFGITTLPGDRVYWWATKNEPFGGLAGDERGYVTEAFRGWADPVPKLIATTLPFRVLRNDIVDRPPISRWASGRAVLIGDAAHPTTPNLGQGGCMAIEDAVVLARGMRSDGDLAHKLASFVAARSPRTSAITRGSWRFGRLGQWGGRLPCWLRDRLFGLLLPLVEPRGLLSYATFDVGPLPTAGPAGASLRE
jgi:2-polyprenyl-6-methoxyphenol hydroxylase-like FAD-dependent oxidoreductase